MSKPNQILPHQGLLVGGAIADRREGVTAKNPAMASRRFTRRAGANRKTSSGDFLNRTFHEHGDAHLLGGIGFPS
jgi:hypothetical protein